MTSSSFNWKSLESKETLIWKEIQSGLECKCNCCEMLLKTFSLEMKSIDFRIGNGMFDKLFKLKSPWNQKCLFQVKSMGIKNTMIWNEVQQAFKRTSIMWNDIQKLVLSGISNEYHFTLVQLEVNVYWQVLLSTEKAWNLKKH